jgi:hypothetical protein
MGLTGGARVVIVLSKADLCADLSRHLEAARSLGPIEIVLASARDGRGMDVRWKGSIW